MSVPKTPPGGSEDLVELDPIEDSGPPRASDIETPIAMDMVEGSLPGLESETQSLLQKRLRLTAGLIAGMHLAIAAWSLAIPEDEAGAITLSLLLRAGLAGGIAAFLSRSKHLSIGVLRGCEAILFYGMILLLMMSQYFGNLEFLKRGEPESVIAYEKNGVLLTIVLMILYGTLIPNHPRKAARLIVLMLIGPLFVFSILLERPLADAEMGTNFNPLALEGSSAIHLAIGAFTAIYSAYILNGLHRDLHRAKQLGQYQLGERLASGGMGDVYMARHRLLKRPCALKLIKPDVSDNDVARARFDREVQAAASLSHPNTIEIFDYGHTPDGMFYYVMEYLPGLSSHDIVGKYGPMPPARAVYLMRQTCGSLAEAHNAGIIHRDLKPANILVAILGGEFDVAKLLDFGLAKVTTPGSADLTGDFTVSGTPSYMSPEQATASPDVDGRADLYSLGAILYHWLTGRPPFLGDNPMEVMMANARDSVIPPSKLKPEIPADLEAVVLKCLEKSPAARFQNARALRDALENCRCAADWNERVAEQWWSQRAREVLETQAAGASTQAPAP